MLAVFQNHHGRIVPRKESPVARLDLGAPKIVQMSPRGVREARALRGELLLELDCLALIVLVNHRLDTLLVVGLRIREKHVDGLGDLDGAALLALPIEPDELLQIQARTEGADEPPVIGLS